MGLQKDAPVEGPTQNMVVEQTQAKGDRSQITLCGGYSYSLALTI